MNTIKLMNIYDLEDFIEDMSLDSKGVLYCFGTSLVSRLIQAKTRRNPNELVPSHVALLSRRIIYESTTSEVEINNKHIRAGVRRWQTDDFINSEKSRLTKYIFLPNPWSSESADLFVHLPYGKDTIVDFLLKDGSDGDSKGLICSQFANMCIRYKHNLKCPTPADLFRQEIKRHNITFIEQ